MYWCAGALVHWFTPLPSPSDPHRCPDYELCASKIHQQPAGKTHDWLQAGLKTADVKGLRACADSHEQKEKRDEVKKQRLDSAGCLTDFNLLRARMEFADKWVETHEDILDWLTAQTDTTRRAAVRVLRYEQLSESPCTCRKLLTFAFGDARQAGELLVPSDEVLESCRYKPAPCTESGAANGTESRRSLGYSRPKEASVPATAVVIRAVSGDIRNWRCTMHHEPCTVAPSHRGTTAPPPI